MRRITCAAAVAVALAATVGPASAQGIHITPALGAFIPASDLRDLRTQAEEDRLAREGTLGLGLNIESGWLRGSIAYATGATITDEGVQNRGEVGDGSVLAVAADVVVRPLPRLLIQPYLLGGLGLKRLDYSYEDDGLGNPLPEDKREVAIHFGVGADVMFGGIGIMAEITDYLTRNEDDSWGQHDAFALIGLRVRLGGSR
ncbi:MAG TPA: hypothetical protein VMQ83_02910 [Gammaproteobacteria bacterium]|nr:hypothetical protein [Gammaproteobacteria bacterium]